MKAFADLAPWRVYSLGNSPFENRVVLQPERDPHTGPRSAGGGRWLCSIRMSNYHMPGSRPDTDPPKGPIRNRNLMVELDPSTWRPIRTVEMFDHSIEGKRGTWTGAGFEDLRLAWTDSGLCAIASAMRPNPDTGGVVEVVVLDLDSDYQIIKATPLRGTWSAQHQKNWQAYQGTHPAPCGCCTRRSRVACTIAADGVVTVHDPIHIDDPFRPPSRRSAARRRASDLAASDQVRSWRA